jgi:hypothetical protein
MTHNTATKVRLGTYVKPELHEQLREAASRNQRSLAGEIRRALYEHVRQEADQGAAQGAVR